MRPVYPALIAICIAPGIAMAEAPPAAAPYCIGDYADDWQELAPSARALEHQPYSFCVRNTATYECLSYDGEGNVRKTRRRAIMHGTAFGYRQSSGETFLLTNQHVAEWPSVTDEHHPVDGVPAGCKRTSETLRIVDSEADDYDRDDVPLTTVAVDPQLDAAVLRAKASLPILPWKIGRSAALRERNVVEVRGFPLGAFQATSVGKVISAYDHDDYKDWDHDDFVVDALLSSGNSGSPVLAVSCRTGELELVGVYHAAYTHGSALNVVVGVDQLRDFMTTMKRSIRPHTNGAVALDETARSSLERATQEQLDPFFPFGPLVATVRPLGSGAVLFAVYTHEFPFKTNPLFAFEDLRQPGAFGEMGRLWFGGPAGLKPYARADLDGETQALVVRLVEGLRRDASSFFAWRSATRDGGTREHFERQARIERTLDRTVESRRDIAQAVSDLAERFAPLDSSTAVSFLDLVVPPLKVIAQQARLPMPVPNERPHAAQ